MPRARVAPVSFSLDCVRSAVRRPDYRGSAQWSSLPFSSVSRPAVSPSSSPCGPRFVERRRRVQEVIVLERALAGAEAELAVERGSLDERLEAAIKTLSTQALDANSTRFLELAETHLTGHVRPLKDSLARMDLQLQSVERVAAGVVRRAPDPGQRPSPSALASSRNALRTPHVRGRWGEAQLRNVVEYAGMVRVLRLRRPGHRDDGRRRAPTRPRRPHSRRQARRRRCEGAAGRLSRRASRRRTRQSAIAVSPTMRARCATTSEKLSAKGYWRQFEPSPDLVVMFLPDESYLRAAQEHDPSLQEYAWSSNVILASPSTLIDPAPDGRDDVAAGEGRRERARGERARPRAVQAARDHGRPLVEARNDLSTARSTRTTRRSARSSARCSSRRGASSSTGSPGSSRPSSSRSSARPGPLAAAELVEPEQTTLEAVSRQAPTLPERGNIDAVDAFTRWQPAFSGLRSALRRRS